MRHSNVIDGIQEITRPRSAKWPKIHIASANDIMIVGLESSDAAAAAIPLFNTNTILCVYVFIHLNINGFRASQARISELKYNK